jgi:phage RecT family recombinase
MATAAAPQQPAQPGLSLVRQKVKSILLSPEAKAQIVPLLPHGVSLDRVVSTIHQVVAENPEILECTPESIIMAVGRGVKQDLEFGDTAHLVPFNVNIAKKGERPRYEKRAKMLRDYKGDIELVKRAGAARDVQAHCFYANEPLKYEQGTSPYIEHHPIVDEKNRGKMIGAYAYARIDVHTLKIAVMSVAEIEEIRQAKSKANKEGPLLPWYAKKTMVHQVTKDIPKNPKLREVEKEFAKEEEEIEDGEFEVVGSSAVVDTASQSASGTSDPPEVAEAATPAATPATSASDTPALVDDATELDPSTLTLEQARKLPLLGPPEAWGGKAGSLLGAFGTGALRQVRKWCVDTIETTGDDPEKQLTIVAIDLIVADREQLATKA